MIVQVSINGQSSLVNMGSFVLIDAKFFLGQLPQL